MSTHGPYSPIRKAGNLYFISGQVGIDPKTRMTGSDIKTQTRCALNNLKELLQQNGLVMDNVIKATVYLTSMDDFIAMNDVYMTYFNEPRPARACVEVAGLPKLTGNKLVVEIEAVVCKP